MSLENPFSNPVPEEEKIIEQQEASSAEKSPEEIRLEQLEAIKTDPRFEALLAETNKWLQMKQELSDNEFLKTLPETDSQVGEAVGKVQAQERFFHDMLNEIDPPTQDKEELSSQDIVNIDTLIENLKKEVAE